MITIKPEEITALSKYIYELSNISLNTKKKYIFEIRLSPLVKELGFSDYKSLIDRAKKDRAMEQKILNAITNNETYFFRDSSTFELLKYTILPELVKKKLK